MKIEISPYEAHHILRALNKYYGKKAGWCVCCEAIEAKLKALAGEVEKKEAENAKDNRKFLP